MEGPSGNFPIPPFPYFLENRISFFSFFLHHSRDGEQPLAGITPRISTLSSFFFPVERKRSDRMSILSFLPSFPSGGTSKEMEFPVPQLAVSPS